MKNKIQFSRWLLVIVPLCLFFIGCGESSVDRRGAHPQVVIGVTVSSDAAVIALDETCQLSAMVRYGDGSEEDMSGTVEWTTSDQGVVTVSSQGMVTASASISGDATLTASYRGYSGTATVQVRDPATIVTGMLINPGSATIDADETIQLTATASYRSGANDDVSSEATWRSSNLSVATINTSGLVSAVNDGTVTITAEFDGIEDSITITVEDPMVSIDVSPNNMTIQRSGTYQYTATATMTSGDTMDISPIATWSSSDPTVATIAAGGLATASSTDSGSTNISAEYDGITSDIAQLTVVEKIVSALTISVPIVPITIDADASVQLTAIATYPDTSTEDVSGMVTWGSSNTNAAVINPSGLCSGVNNGTTVISASIWGATSNSLTLSVDDPLRSIDISPDTATLDLEIGPLTQQYVAQGTYASGDSADLAGQATWSSSDSGIVSIDGTGLATAVSVGTAFITAESNGVTSDTATVTVGSTVVPESIAITPTTSTIDADETQAYQAIVTYSDSSTADMTGSVTWNTSVPSVATINVSGVASGAGAGTTIITAEYMSITSNTATLNVLNPLRAIDISPDAVSIDADGTQQYSATGTYASGATADLTSTVTWDSSNGSAAGISTNGLASGINDGASNITAIYSGITSDTSVLTVNDPLRSINISPDTAEIVNSATRQYTATGLYASGDTADLTASATWDSSDTAIADFISTAGLATADNVNIGVTDITASADGITSDTATLSVVVTPVVPVSIAISPANTTIAADETQQYQAIVTFDDASTADMTGSVTWYSSDESAATIGSSSGLASGVAAGTTTITAEYDAITSNAATLTVDDPLRSIDISPNSATIDADQSQQYGAIGTYATGATVDLTNFADWDSTNMSAAVIGLNTGLAEGVNNGSTTITAAYDGVTSDASVLTVNDPLRSISISSNDNAIDLSVNPTTEQYSAEGTYASGDTADITVNVTWSSSNTGVATIGASTGLAAGVDNGTTEIRASLSGILSAPENLVVTDPPVSLAINPSTARSIILGNTLQYSATVTYASTQTASVTGTATWNSSAPAAATINASGLASSVDVGATNISASYTESSVTVNSANAQLNVTNDPVSLNISPDSATIPGSGSTQQYSATATLENASTIDVTSTAVWSSSDTNVATIDADGLATRVSTAGGTTNISATYGGIPSDTATLTFVEAAPEITNIDLHRSSSASNTEMELWNQWLANGGSVTSFSTATTSYYAYIAGFNQVTLVISAPGATTFKINGTDYAATDTYTRTVTFPSQGENAITVQAGNGGGYSAEYTITVNLLSHYNFFYGFMTPYMQTTIEDKWYAINPSRDNGDELTINGNVSGSLYWKIQNSFTIDCDDVVSDEAAVYFGESAGDYCGSSGLFGAFNLMRLTAPYNDGNATYSGNQDGHAWSANWHIPANEGGITYTGDTVGDITNILNKSGMLMGRFDFYSDGALIAQVYEHYVINGGDIVENANSYADLIYMGQTARYALDKSAANPLE